jgi:outer membrane protein insertion porin family
MRRSTSIQSLGGVASAPPHPAARRRRRLGWLWALSLLTVSALEVLPPAVATAQSASPGAAAQLPEVAYVFERLSVRGNVKTRAYFFRNLLGLVPGERVRVSELDRFRRRLLSTGFFAHVETRLVPGSEPQAVTLEVTVEERNTLVIGDVYFGVSAEEAPFWGGLDLAETNLLGSGLLLGGAFVVSSEQAGFRASLADPFASLAPFAWYAEGRFSSAVGRGPSIDEQGRPATVAFDYDRGGGRVGVGLTPWSRRFGIELDYRLESLGFAYAQPTRRRPETGLVLGRSLLSNLGVLVEYDSRDRAALPTSGLRAALRLDGGGAFLGSDYAYLRLVGQAQLAVGITRYQVLRFGLSGGALFADDGRAPYFEGFYVGDISELVAGRDLELQFTDRRTLDLLGNGADLVTYGDRFGRLSAEWAIEIRPVWGALNRVELFVSAGLFALDSGPWEIGRPAIAVTGDVGAESTGVHFDVTLNAGLRADTPVGFLELSLGQALSVAPLD